MTFPTQVIEIKERLQDEAQHFKERKETYDVLCKLTEPKESVYLKEYEAMWKSLLKAEQKNNDLLDNRWVLDFLDAVTEATDLPPYFYISGKERRELIGEIHKHTVALEKIYTNQAFNQKLISNDGQFFHGFSSYEVFENENGSKTVDKGRPPKVSVIDILQFFDERAEEQINESAHRGKAGENIKGIRFIRILAERNLQSYGRPLNAVLKTAAFALYDLEYSESDISNLLNRQKKQTSP